MSQAMTDLHYEIDYIGDIEKHDYNTWKKFYTEIVKNYSLQIDLHSFFHEFNFNRGHHIRIRKTGFILRANTSPPPLHFEIKIQRPLCQAQTNSLDVTNNARNKLQQFICQFYLRPHEL